MLDTDTAGPDMNAPHPRQSPLGTGEGHQRWAGGVEGPGIQGVWLQMSAGLFRSSQEGCEPWRAWAMDMLTLVIPEGPRRSAGGQGHLTGLSPQRPYRVHRVTQTRTVEVTLAASSPGIESCKACLPVHPSPRPVQLPAETATQSPGSLRTSWLVTCPRFTPLHWLPVGFPSRTD